MYRDPETAGKEYAEEVQKIIKRQQSQNRGVAAFIHESVMSNAGIIYFPNGFLQAAYKLVDKRNGGSSLLLSKFCDHGL